MGPLYDRITQHPGVFGIVCVAWIAIAIWIVSLIGWMIQGDVDGLFGFLGIFVALALGYFSFMPPTEAMRPFTAIAIVLTVVMFPILRQALNTRALVTIDIEAMENCYELLALKPENHLIRFKLAKLLYGRGQIPSAIAIGAEALQGLNEKLFVEEQRMHSRWKRQNPQVRADATVICIDCGHANPASKIHCERCHQPYLLHSARGLWVGPQFAKKLMAGWIAGILALAGIPLASQLPPTGAILVIVLIMIGATAVVWVALKSSKESVRS